MAGGGTVGHKGEVHVRVGCSLEDDSGVLRHVAFDRNEFYASVNNLQTESGDALRYSVFKGAPEAGEATLTNVNRQRGVLRVRDEDRQTWHYMF